MNINKFIKRVGIIRLFFIITLIVSVISILLYFSIRKEWRVIYVEVVPKNWATTFNPYGAKAPYWMAQVLKPGLKEVDFTGRTVAEVLNVDKYERGGEDTQVFLTLRVKASYNQKLDRYIYKGIPLDIGSPIELLLGHADVLGQVIDNNYPKGGYPHKTVVLTVRAWSLEPWIVDKISTGSAVFNTATKEIMAQVLDTRTEEPMSNLLLNTYDGYSITITKNPRLKDLIMRIRAKVQLIDNRWYFLGLQQVKMGETLWFRFNSLDINNVEVMDIQDESPQTN